MSLKPNELPSCDVFLEIKIGALEGTLDFSLDKEHRSFSWTMKINLFGQRQDDIDARRAFLWAIARGDIRECEFRIVHPTLIKLAWGHALELRSPNLIRLAWGQKFYLKRPQVLLYIPLEVVAAWYRAAHPEEEFSPYEIPF